MQPSGAIHPTFNGSPPWYPHILRQGLPFPATHWIVRVQGLGGQSRVGGSRRHGTGVTACPSLPTGPVGGDTAGLRRLKKTPSLPVIYRGGRHKWGTRTTAQHPSTAILVADDGHRKRGLMFPSASGP